MKDASNPQDERLLRVQRNRPERRSASLVGARMWRVVDRLGDDAQSIAHLAASAITEFVDDDFRTHCRLGSIGTSRLRVNVDHAGLVYSMRAKWLPTLKRVLVEEAGRSLVRTVEFGYGTDGVTLVGLAALG